MQQGKTHPSSTGVWRENTKPCSSCPALDAYSGITKDPVGMRNPALQPHHLQHTWPLLSWLPDSSSWHLEHPRVPLNLRLHLHLFIQRPLRDSDLATLYLVLPTFSFSLEVYVAANLHDPVALELRMSGKSAYVVTPCSTASSRIWPGHIGLQL